MVLFSLLLYLAQRIQTGEMAHDQCAFGILANGENQNGYTMKRKKRSAPDRNKAGMAKG